MVVMVDDLLNTFKKSIKGTKILADQKNVMQGQRPDMEYKNKEHKITKIIRHCWVW